MPDLEKKTSDSGYEGAIVLPPKCKMYMDNPVACGLQFFVSVFNDKSELFSR